jgi:tRNA threonylcarbamoyladenosine dehydratase
MDENTRTELLIGECGINKLKNSKVIIFGIGGVGSFTAESLARCSVGHIVMVDDDKICVSNINRQIHSTQKTVGKPKVEVMADRINEINPNIKITIIKKFVNKESIENIITKDANYIVDAIDTITNKLLIIEKAKSLNIQVISSMGVGNKINPQLLQLKDINKTKVCPMARVMRKELKNKRIKNLTVCYSEEKPIATNLKDGVKTKSYFKVPKTETRPGAVRRQLPGSISFVPATAGLFIAGQVVRDIVGVESLHR